MVSHDVHVIRDTLNAAKFKDPNSLLASRFILMVEEHVAQKEIVRVRDFCELLFAFNTCCDLIYERERDFAGVVAFSRDRMHDVLDSEADTPLMERVDVMRQIALSMKADLESATGVKID